MIVTGYHLRNWNWSHFLVVFASSASVRVYQTAGGLETGHNSCGKVLGVVNHLSTLASGGLFATQKAPLNPEEVRSVSPGIAG